MTKIKICGITNENDLNAAIEFGADAVGFVAGLQFESHRNISPKLASKLVSMTPPFLTTVMVTVLNNIRETMDLFDEVDADILQIHGEIGIDTVEKISKMTNKKLIVGISPENKISRQMNGLVDAILFDSIGKLGAGGTGKINNWDLAREMKQELSMPVILAGGLIPENVVQAIEHVKPFAVDVSSGVEGPDGLKDHVLIKRFISNVRKIEK